MATSNMTDLRRAVAVCTPALMSAGVTSITLQADSVSVMGNGGAVLLRAVLKALAPDADVEYYTEYVREGTRWRHVFVFRPGFPSLSVDVQEPVKASPSWWDRFGYWLSRFRPYRWDRDVKVQWPGVVS